MRVAYLIENHIITHLGWISKWVISVPHLFELLNMEIFVVKQHFRPWREWPGFTDP